MAAGNESAKRPVGRRRSYIVGPITARHSAPMATEGPTPDRVAFVSVRGSEPLEHGYRFASPSGGPDGQLADMNRYGSQLLKYNYRTFEDVREPLTPVR